jgi:predicted  nucleic acid-binding Zn-ribbon protein
LICPGSYNSDIQALRREISKNESKMSEVTAAHAAEAGSLRKAAEEAQVELKRVRQYVLKLEGGRGERDALDDACRAEMEQLRKEIGERESKLSEAATLHAAEADSLRKNVEEAQGELRRCKVMRVPKLETPNSKKTQGAEIPPLCQ